MSELYFVSTRQFTSLPFGGMIDNVIDPTTKLAVGIRLFGEYSVKAIDSEALIVNLAGTKDLETNEELVDWVKEQLLKNFREVVSSYVSEQNKPILGIASQASEFEAKVLELVQRDLEEYGLEIPKLGNVTISIKEEDEETLKQMTRDFAYANNAAAADVAMKLGMAEGLKKGGAGADAAQVSAGVATGMGIAAGMSAASNAQSGSDKPKDEDTDNTDK
jgi:membrane protease subunit (stomatin/prohibitin family)